MYTNVAVPTLQALRIKVLFLDIQIQGGSGYESVVMPTRSQQLIGSFTKFERIHAAFTATDMKTFYLDSSRTLGRLP